MGVRLREVELDAGRTVERAGDRAGAAVFSLPRPAAARSRATPATPAASGRFGVSADVDHRIVEPGEARVGSPTGASSGAR